MNRQADMMKPSAERGKYCQPAICNHNSVLTVSTSNKYTCEKFQKFHRQQEGEIHMNCIPPYTLPHSPGFRAQTPTKKSPTSYSSFSFITFFISTEGNIPPKVHNTQVFLHLVTPYTVSLWCWSRGNGVSRSSSGSGNRCGRKRNYSGFVMFLPLLCTTPRLL